MYFLIFSLLVCAGMDSLQVHLFRGKWLKPVKPEGQAALEIMESGTRGRSLIKKSDGRGISGEAWFGGRAKARGLCLLCFHLKNIQAERHERRV